MAKKKPSVSVILPTYNERENIELFIPQIEKLLSKYKLEIIVVDDSSPDGTAKAAERLNRRYGNIKLLKDRKKEGIGAAVRAGYEYGSHDILVSSDADLSFLPEDLLKLIARIEEGYDLVVGSRHLSGQHYKKERASTALKWVVSYCGNKVIRKILRVPVHDVSANFRAIRRSVWNELQTTEKTNSMLLEMILEAHSRGYKVCEVPVVFKERLHGESKLNLPKESLKFITKFVKFSLKYRLRR